MNIITTLLALALILGAAFYENKLDQLEQTLAAKNKQTPQQEAVGVQDTVATADVNNELNALNTQLIEAHNKIRDLEGKVSLYSTGQAALKNEIKKNKQMAQAKSRLQHDLKTSKSQLKQAHDALQETQQTLNTERAQAKADRQQLARLKNLANVFKEQQKQAVENSIERIQKLKEASGGTLISGAVLPIVGAAGLVAYTVNEIKYYCEAIKNSIALEKQLFGEAATLNDSTAEHYQQECLNNPIIN